MNLSFYLQNLHAHVVGLYTKPWLSVQQTITAWFPYFRAKTNSRTFQNPSYYLSAKWQTNCICQNVTSKAFSQPLLISFILIGNFLITRTTANFLLTVLKFQDLSSDSLDLPNPILKSKDFSRP